MKLLFGPSFINNKFWTKYSVKVILAHAGEKLIMISYLDNSLLPSTGSLNKLFQGIQVDRENAGWCWMVN